MITGSRQLVEQRLRLFEILCVEAFGEPAVHRREEAQASRRCLGYRVNPWYHDLAIDACRRKSLCRRRYSICWLGVLCAGALRRGGVSQVQAGHAPPKVRFGTDSLLEGEGFEPSVPRRRDDAFRDCPVRPLRRFPFRDRKRLLRAGDRRFESPSLYRRVCCQE